MNSWEEAMQFKRETIKRLAQEALNEKWDTHKMLNYTIESACAFCHYYVEECEDCMIDHHICGGLINTFDSMDLHEAEEAEPYKLALMRHSLRELAKWGKLTKQTILAIDGVIKRFNHR